MNMGSIMPSGKMKAAGATGIAAWVLCLILNQYVLAGNPLSSETVSGLVLIAAWAGGYIKEPDGNDVGMIKVKKEDTNG